MVGSFKIVYASREGSRKFILFLFTFLSSRTLSEDEYKELGYYQFDAPRQIESFELTNHNGYTVGLETLRVRWTLMFFGFTFCPDICPTTMGVLARAVKKACDRTFGRKPIVDVSVLRV